MKSGISDKSSWKDKYEKKNQGTLRRGACMPAYRLLQTRIVIDVTKDGTASGNVTLLMSVSMLTMDGTSIEDSMAEMEAQYREQYPDAKIEPYREGEGENEYAGVRVNLFA